MPGGLERSDRIIGGVMKGRLNRALLMMIVVLFAALFAVLYFAYNAGAGSIEGAKGRSLSEFASLPGHAGMPLLVAFVICLAAGLGVWFMLANRVMAPVKTLVEFSERLSNGDDRTKASVDSADDFGLIAEHLNRAAESSSRAMFNQEAQESLQKRVTEFLTIVSQIARGDLTLRGRVTNDALGNVVDSVNYMLDNFAKVLERVRKAAIDVSGSANQILDAADDMTAGATQQDQEITNTSSAVEELTV